MVDEETFEELKKNINTKRIYKGGDFGKRNLLFFQEYKLVNVTPQSGRGTVLRERGSAYIMKESAVGYRWKETEKGDREKTDVVH